MKKQWLTPEVEFVRYELLEQIGYGDLANQGTSGNDLTFDFGDTQ